MQELVRTSLRLTKDMHDWYKTEANNIGIPLNAMIVFALMQYQREQTILPNIPDIVQAMVEANKLNAGVKLVDSEENPV
jgi:hypothetical protein